MPMYSEEIIEEIRSRNDIVDVISSYVQLKKSGSNYFGLCPFHNENSPSFSVTRSKQMFYCFGCHMGGNVYTFLMEYNKCTFPEAVEELAGRCGYALPKQPMSNAQKKRQTKRTKLKNIYKDAANFYYARLHSSGGKAGMDYFRNNRNLDSETMKNFALGYADKKWDSMYQFLKQKGYEEEIMKDSGLVVFDEKKGPRDYFINRVMFPILDASGNPIALGGRVLDDSKPKYLNSRENEVFEKRNTIYGYNIAKRTRRDMFILCEGYMDVIALHRAGFDNAIAALGTALTKQHVKKLKDSHKKIYLCFDSDFAGVDAALRAIGMLRLLEVDCKVITMEEYKDPDEYIKAKGAEAFEERIKNAENSFLFSIRKRREDFDVNDPEENNRFFRNMAGRIITIPTEIERENYIVVLADMYNVSPDSLRELIRDVSKNKDELNAIEEEVYKGYRKSDFFNENDEPKVSTFPKKVDAKNKSKEGLKETEGILLTWLLDEPDLYSAIKEYIDPMDFSEGLYRDIATEMFESLSEDKEFEPASIMCAFEDNEAHQEIAKMLHTKVEGLESKRDKEILLKETLIKLKKEGLNSIDKSSPGAGKRLRKIKEDIRHLNDINLL